jgi:hypothetical protein
MLVNMRNNLYIRNKKSMFYIYHIKGVKIGCATKPKVRVNNQGFTNYEILETHTDIMIASNREIELQKKYGYKVDECPYYITYKLNTERRKKLTNEIITSAAKKGGNANVVSGNIYKAQQRSVEVRTGTFHSEETKQKMREKALGRVSARKGVTVSEETKLKMSEAKKRYWEQIKSKS